MLYSLGQNPRPEDPPPTSLQLRYGTCTPPSSLCPFSEKHTCECYLFCALSYQHALELVLAPPCPPYLKVEVLPWATVMSPARCFHSADVTGWATGMEGDVFSTRKHHRSQTAEEEPTDLAATSSHPLPLLETFSPFSPLWMPVASKASNPTFPLPESAHRSG